MKRALLAVLLAAVAIVPAGFAAEPDAGLSIAVQPLGDRDGSVVVEIVFRYTLAHETLQARPVLQGSILSGSEVVRHIRRAIRPDENARLVIIEAVPPGEIRIDARMLIESDDSMPLLLGKAVASVTVAAVGEPYVAGDEATADAVVAEGVVPEGAGTVTIRPPRRDVAPNLFIVDVDVLPPVTRVEFQVDGKKLFTRNRPPFRAELDLGAIPRRVEVTVIGYDRQGRFVDADSFIVNERENVLELTINRTVSDDGISRFRIAVQNPRDVPLREVAFFAGERKIIEWAGPPYAIDLPTASLAGAEFVRATAITGDGHEASDLLYLDGQRYFEEIDVNLVELPASVTDTAGAPIVDLSEKDFEVFEEGKKQTISSFAFSRDLPLSVGVLVDHSGSMESRIEQAREAALSFFQKILRPSDRAFFGGFSWEASSISPFVADLGSLRSQVDQMPEAEGATALYDAIVLGLYRFRTVPGRKALVIVTDGDDTASRIPYEDMLQYVRVARVPIYFIGIDLSRLDFSAAPRLRGLAEETGGVAYFVRRAGELDQVYERLEQELRTQYLIGYYAETTRNDRDYRKVELEVNRPGAKVRTIRGFIP